MSTLTITEFQGVGKQASSDQQAATLLSATTQKVTFTGAVGFSAPLQVGTTLVRLFSDAACAVKMAATSASAASTDLPIASGSPEYFAATGSVVISAISYS